MTATTYDEVKICNIALAGIGGGSIESISSPSTDLEADCANAFALVVESLLSHEWNWAQAEVALARDLDVTPIKDYDYAFRLPSAMLAGPSGVWGNGSPLNDGQWCVKGAHLYCSYTTVKIDFSKKPPVSIWPPYFVNLVVAALRAQLAIPVRESVSMSEKFEVQAFGTPEEGGRGGLFRMARNLDAKSKPVKSLFRNGDPFSATRY